MGEGWRNKGENLRGRTSLRKAYRNKATQCRLEHRGPEGDGCGEMMGEGGVDHKGPFVLGI